MARPQFAGKLSALVLATCVVCSVSYQFKAANLRHAMPHAAKQSKPHVLFILADDLGFGDVGYLRNRTSAGQSNEVQTPEIDNLVASGVELSRMYAHKFCSPTRSSIQSGRAPIHVNVINAQPQFSNPNDLVGGFAGIPRNMTCIAELMRQGGYATHFVGKWDVGMATQEHSPSGRGYNSSLHYWGNSIDYWQFTEQKCASEPMGALWEQNSNDTFGHPAQFKNDEECSDEEQHPQGPCDYLDSVLEERVKAIIVDHDSSVPLFLFWATHLVHSPLSVPESTLQQFKFVKSFMRRKMKSMVNFLDGAVGRVVQELKQKDMYSNTLIVFMSDNGGPLPTNTNYPLRGGKFTNFDGGIRVVAFISGGYIPENMRGTSLDGLMASWDWYATFASLAGVSNTFDARALEAGLPPHDSLNMWPMLSGQNTTSPRLMLEIGDNAAADLSSLGSSGAALVGGLIMPPYKLILGGTPNEQVGGSFMAGPDSPADHEQPMFYLDIVTKHTMHCGRTPETGCLFDIYKDPSEEENVASSNPDQFNMMLNHVNALQEEVYDPDRGRWNNLACKAALNTYHGNWGPYLN